MRERLSPTKVYIIFLFFSLIEILDLLDLFGMNFLELKDYVSENLKSIGVFFVQYGNT